MLLLIILYLALILGIVKSVSWLLIPLSILWRHVIRRPLDFQKRYGAGWIVITAGELGLGRAYAEYFAARKFSILLIDSNPKRLSEMSNQIARQFGVPVATIEEDLSTYPVNPKVFTQVYAQIKEKTRKEPIKGLINFPKTGYKSNFITSTSEMIDDMINSNITQVAHMTRVLVEDLQVSRSSFIIFTCNASCLDPQGQEAVYAGTMAYSRRFGIDMGMELEGIDVLVVEHAEAVPSDEKSLVEFSLRELGRGKETMGSRGELFKHWWNSTMPGLCKKQRNSRISDTKSKLNVKKNQ